MLTIEKGEWLCMIKPLGVGIKHQLYYIKREWIIKGRSVLGDLKGQVTGHMKLISDVYPAEKINRNPH